MLLQQQSAQLLHTQCPPFWKSFSQQEGTSGSVSSKTVGLYRDRELNMLQTCFRRVGYDIVICSVSPGGQTAICGPRQRAIWDTSSEVSASD